MQRVLVVLKALKTGWMTLSSFWKLEEIERGIWIRELDLDQQGNLSWLPLIFWSLQVKQELLRKFYGQYS